MTTNPAPTTASTPLQLWRDYAACWTIDAAARLTELAPYVTPDVVYRDPLAEVQGLDAFGAYMEGFAAAFPGHRFEIDAVETHHARSLARWRQVDAADESVMHGTSLALHHEDGRLADITGFFAVSQA